MTLSILILLYAGFMLAIWYAVRWSLRLTPPLFTGGLDPIRSYRTMDNAWIVGCVVGVTFLPVLLSGEPEKEPTVSQLVAGPLIYAALIAAVIAFLLVRTHLGGMRHFGFRRCPIPRAALLGFQYGLAAIPPVLSLSYCMGALATRLGLEQPMQAIFGQLKDPAVPLWAKATLICATVLIAPVYEEMLFRGLLFPALLGTRPKGWSAALLCGTAFALVHMQATSFLPLLLLSVLLCAGYLATGSLLTPIVMHIVFNGMNLLIWFELHTTGT